MSEFQHMATAVLKHWARTDGANVAADRRTKFVGWRALASVRPMDASFLNPVNFRDKLWDRQPVNDVARAMQLFAPDGRHDFKPELGAGLGAVLRPMAPLSWFSGDMSALVDREGNPAVLIACAGSIPLSDRKTVLVACGWYGGS
ncbi:MAG TPA: hypothetical protein VLL76_11875, partial [Candidatus Omnitrophota bacterium]|nr:hypothetical protein [Candidatus Omnitrophota bacterium]